MEEKKYRVHQNRDKNTPMRPISSTTSSSRIMSKQILPTLKRGEDDKAVPVKNIKRVNGGKATGQLVRENEKDMRLEQENKKDERIKHYKRIVRHTGITPLQKATGAILVPEMTTKDRQELEAARIFVEKNMTEQDEMDDEDISMVAEYSQENFEHLRTLEELHKPLTRDGDHQSEESWIARAELMDWLVKVHDKYNLVHESLFLAVNYFDRYFLANKDKDVNLKLIGAASLLIATKYEAIATKYEGDCLDHGRLVEQLVEKARNTFTREELLKAMRLMIKKLNYSLGWPDPMRFLRRISRADGYGSSPGDISEYFLYITVVDKHFVGCAPSFLSAGVYCLRRYMLGKGQWSQRHVYYSGYTLTQLRPLISAILECCGNQRIAMKNRYYPERYKHASKFVDSIISDGYRLPWNENKITSAHSIST